MGCGNTTMKCVLFCFNVVFCVMSLVLIALGGIIQHELVARNNNSTLLLAKLENKFVTDLYEETNHFDPEVINVVSIVLIAVGCAAFFIAFLGCCAISRDSKCILITYAFLLTLILTIQVIGGVLALISWKEIVGPHFEKNIRSLFMWFGIVSLVGAILQLAQVVLSCVLAKKNRGYVEYH